MNSHDKSDVEAIFARRVGPAGRANPDPKKVYDLAVIGAGPAGLAAAEYAAQLGFSVALVERDRLGGVSLNTGSVPSKAMIRTARVYRGIQNAGAYAAPEPNEPAIAFSEVVARMRRIRSRIANYHSLEDLAALGVDVFFGAARFRGYNSLAVGEGDLRFEKVIIATGARPKRPAIPGLEGIGYHTSETIFDLPSLPRRIAVIGGGPLGCELAQAFCRLGSYVTIIQNDPKFLPREERDAAEILSRAMARDGVQIRLNTTVVGARRDGRDKILETTNYDISDEIRADEILLSIGRVANIDGLDLTAGGIVTKGDHSVSVDEFLRTANPDVFAAGDVCLTLKFANAALSTARLAVRNALLGTMEKHDGALIPWCTFCDPEIAHIGLQVWEARERSIPVKSYTIMMHDVDRAITDGEDEGFVKIHVRDGTDQILGATIVATRASEMINEMAVILNAGIGMKALAETIHTYPAQSEAIMLAAQAYRRDCDRRTADTT